MIDYLEVAKTSLANEARKRLPALSTSESVGPNEWPALHPPAPIYHVHFTQESDPEIFKYLGFCTVTFRVRVDFTQGGDVAGTYWDLVKVSLGNEDGAEQWVRTQMEAEQPKRRKRNATAEVVDA